MLLSTVIVIKAQDPTITFSDCLGETSSFSEFIRDTSFSYIFDKNDLVISGYDHGCQEYSPNYIVSKNGTNITISIPLSTCTTLAPPCKRRFEIRIPNCTEGDNYTVKFQETSGTTTMYASKPMVQGLTHSWCDSASKTVPFSFNSSGYNYSIFATASSTKALKQSQKQIEIDSNLSIKFNPVLNITDSTYTYDWDSTGVITPPEYSNNSFIIQSDSVTTQNDTASVWIQPTSVNNNLTYKYLSTSQKKNGNAVTFVKLTVFNPINIQNIDDGDMQSNQGTFTIYTDTVVNDIHVPNKNKIVFQNHWSIICPFIPPCFHTYSLITKTVLDGNEQGKTYWIAKDDGLKSLAFNLYDSLTTNVTDQSISLSPSNALIGKISYARLININRTKLIAVKNCNCILPADLTISSDRFNNQACKNRPVTFKSNKQANDTTFSFTWNYGMLTQILCYDCGAKATMVYNQIRPSKVTGQDTLVLDYKTSYEYSNLQLSVSPKNCIDSYYTKTKSFNFSLSYDSLPNMPIVSDKTYKLGEKDTLTAIGDSLKWYVPVQLLPIKTTITTAQSLPYSASTVGISQIFVTQTNGTCESEKATMNITVKDSSIILTPLDPTENADTLINKMVGNWEWTTTCGGVMYSCDSAESVGYTQRLQFTKNTSTANAIDYKMFKNDTLVSSGTYGLIYGKTIFSSTQKRWQYKYNGGFSNIIVNMVDSNTLSLDANCYDCTGSEYKRLLNYVPAPQLATSKPFTINGKDSVIITSNTEILKVYVNDSINGGTINWYSDSTLLKLVGTGNTYSFHSEYGGYYYLYTTRTLNGNTSKVSHVNLLMACVQTMDILAPIEISVPLYKGSIVLHTYDSNILWYLNGVGKIDSGKTCLFVLPKADTIYTIYTIYPISSNPPCAFKSQTYHIKITNDLPFLNTTDTTISMNVGDSIDVAFFNNASYGMSWSIGRESNKKAIDTVHTYTLLPTQLILGAGEKDIYTLKALKVGVDTVVWNQRTLNAITGTKRIIIHIGSQIPSDTCPKIVMKPINESICTPLDKKNPTTLNINYTHEFSYLYKPQNVYPVDTIIVKSTLGINPQEVGITVHFNNGCNVYAPDSIIVTQYTSPSTPQIHDFYFEPTDTKLLSLDSAVDKNCQISWSCISYGKVLFLGDTLQLNTFFNTIGEYPFIVQSNDSMSHCSSIKTSFTVNVMNPSLPSISGQIKANDNPFNDGIVQLFKQNGTHYSAISTQSINTDGSFTFKWLNASNYLIRVLPNDLPSVYLPTYYVSSTAWQDANIIALHGTIHGLHLSLVQCGRLVSGNGSITGVVAVLDSNFASKLKAFTPISMPVIVMQNGQIVAYALIDADGNYKVDNLPDGTYDVYVEAPGYSKCTTSVSINNGSSTTASFTLKNGTVETSESIETSDDVSLYPNPAAETVMVKTSKTVESLEILNLEGVVVQKQQGNQKVLDISQLSSGMYIVKIISETGITVKQLIKQGSVLR